MDSVKKNPEENFKSALNVQKGIEQPESINPDLSNKFKRRKKNQYTVDEYVEGVLSGNRTMLGQAITLIESSLPEHCKIAFDIIEKCLPYARRSIRVGITGVPGVGKSTFIEALGKYTTNQGKKLAVLAVDPSSERTKGSILGDKTRMEELATDPNAFIRPSPSAGSLGGVARKTRETIILCEAAGFNTIFIETVGVGQSETAVHSMVDFFLLLMLAGAGDELQGIKRGIMEMADAIAITKADSENVQKAEMAKIEYQNALHLFPPTDSGWIPKVFTCSSRKGTGIDTVWNNINEYVDFVKKNDFFEHRRMQQAKYWMYESINEALRDHFYNQQGIKEKLLDFEDKVLQRKTNSFLAARILLDEYFKEKK
ncbi:MAG: ATPase/protein kinase [Bacteroidetes bacterium GWC2_33_15]|nr:MAG: ATPase/protein kinase [Bacteroidetes bacterium GWA2_33_15]OFX50026.1 MAG: ATPase/protein kinase [Bacteroidetes bacterium GWC2_33_15]OFX65180.1 MAG: ATPase/protein kinase [Bacteroidetes bacterium GWB2_32_14]OFX70405.1 MAG: ATPase/protein kinase [Bacteroidetes bacterium GWD2_33_33]HAN19727.1 methylmalonyl Co-A mutase-associated GTPase MeaB [Bacteroidales bacterium]